MRAPRWIAALDSGALDLPAAGRLVVMNARAGDDLSMLPKDRTLIVQGFRPDHDALTAQGFRVAPALTGEGFAAAIVCLPRAKDAAHGLIAAASAAVAAGGRVAVDGQKTDGIDSVLRDLRARVAVSDPVSKAHGKFFTFAAGADLADWAALLRVVGDGFTTMPGVFSADGPDRGSVLLANALPPQMKGRGVDLGAGWGYLSRAALARDGVARLDVVEAEADALACARLNVPNARAVFHWADAGTYRPERPAHWVVCNPPFHTGRAADPAVGEVFLRAAARMLVPDGALWLVANRHLPYDRTLTTLFREVADIGGDAAFRLTRAARPVPLQRR